MFNWLVIDRPVVLAYEMGIFLDPHNGGESQSSFVQRLAEIGSKHTRQDSFVDGPEKFLARLLVNMCDFLANICCCLDTVSYLSWSIIWLLRLTS